MMLQDKVHVFSGAGRTILWAAAGTCVCTFVGYYIYGRQWKSRNVVPSMEVHGERRNVSSAVDNPSADDETSGTGVDRQHSRHVNDLPDLESNIHIRHPIQQGCHQPLGMVLVSEPHEQSDYHQHHIIKEVSFEGLAHQMELQAGDELLRLNGMTLAHWSHQVLVEQFRIILVEDIYIAVRRRVVEDDQVEIRYLEYHVTVRVQENRLQGGVIDVETITLEKNLQVIVARPDRKQCYVQHVASGLYIKLEETNGIVLCPLRREDPSFNMERVLFHAMEDDMHTRHGGCSVLVFLFKGNSINKYISILGRNQPLGLQHHDRIRDHTEVLRSADPRFFYHSYTATGQDTFESTEMPGYYLASNGETLRLKEQAPGPVTDDSVQFKVWYCCPSE